jgi:hypothetical protein
VLDIYDKSNPSYKKDAVKRVYTFALSKYQYSNLQGGDIEMSPADIEFTKKREMKGIGKVMFHGGRMFLEVILKKHKIDIMYIILGRGANAKVMIFTSFGGLRLGFAYSW